MFWKKKRTSFELDKDALVESNNQRNSYRVSPTEDRPVNMVLGKSKVPVLDISASGVAFKVKGRIKFGTQIKSQLEFPGPQPNIDIVIEVLRIENDVCHCLIKEISTKDAECIHAYILQVQKEEIKKQKKFKSD